MNNKLNTKKSIKRTHIWESIVVLAIIFILVGKGIIIIPGYKYSVAYINSTPKLKAAATNYTSYCSMSRDDAYEKLGSFQDGNGNLKCNIEDQSALGLCWDFAFTKVLELSAQKKFGTVYDFSERYVDYSTSKVVHGEDYWRNLGGGGSFPFYEEYMAEKRNKFLVQKKDFDADDYMLYTGFDSYGESCCSNSEAAIRKYNSTKTEDIYVRKIIHFTPIEKDEVTNQIITEDGEKIRNQIKQCIVDNGSVGFCINMLMEYFSNEHASLAQDGIDAEPMEAPHAVTAIGWDDNYPMENFVLYDKYVEAGIDPTERMGNGAYICMNSYGDTYGKNGFFYVSYYDHFAERDVIGVSTSEIFGADEVNVHSYDNIYDYYEEEDKYDESKIINSDRRSQTIVVPKSIESEIKIANPTDITVSIDKVILNRGENAQITIEPANTPVKCFYSNNPRCVDVSDSGLVTARNEGRAIITVVTKQGKCADIVVNCGQIENEAVEPEVGHLIPPVRAVTFNDENIYNYAKKLLSADIENYDDTRNMIVVQITCADPRDELIFDMEVTSDNIGDINTILDFLPNIKRIILKNTTYKSASDVKKDLECDVSVLKFYDVQVENSKIKNALKKNMANAVISVTKTGINLDLYTINGLVDLSNAQLTDSDINDIREAFKDRLSELRFNFDNNSFTDNANFNGINVASMKNQGANNDKPKDEDNPTNSEENGNNTEEIIDFKKANIDSSDDQTVSNKSLAKAGEKGFLIIVSIVIGIVFAFVIKKKMK